MTDLLSLAARVEAMQGSSAGVNALDVLIEIAMFQPDDEYVAIRANAAGTKVIMTAPAGHNDTFWAFDWTIESERPRTIAALRERAVVQSEEAGNG